MANTLPSLTIIAQEALPVLQQAVPVLSAFTTDFSSEVAQQGSAVATRIPGSMTANLYSSATGYAPTDVSTTAVTVTLNAPAYAVVGFTDAEVGNLTMQRLINTFIKPAIYGVINKVASDTFALVTSGNYGAATYIGTGYTFTNCIQSPMAALAAAGVTSDKAVILHSTPYYGVLGDIKAQNIIGDTTVIREGYLGNLAGASVQMAAGLPSNGENLVGFACGKEAIAIATRLPFIPSNAPMISVENVTDEKSGLTIQLRQWYSPDKGMYLFGAVLAYGVAKGNTSALKRITSA